MGHLFRPNLTSPRVPSAPLCPPLLLLLLAPLVRQWCIHPLPVNSPTNLLFLHLLWLNSWRLDGALWIMYNTATWLQACTPFFDIALQKLALSLKDWRSYIKNISVSLFMLQQIRWWCRGLRLGELLLPGWKFTSTSMNIAFHTDVRNEHMKSSDVDNRFLTKRNKKSGSLEYVYINIFSFSTKYYTIDIFTTDHTIWWYRVHRFKSFVAKITKYFLYKIIWKPSTWQSGML